MNRRSFLRGLIAAPAIVAASSIMPVRAIERFAQPIGLYGSYAELREFQMREICRIFQVPAHLIIPTASADDLCHFGQETETLSPDVSRRLLRAWGADSGSRENIASRSADRSGGASA